MTTLGVQMMMLKDEVARDGMYSVLERIKDLGYESVEVSQIPLDEPNTRDLERGVAELGLTVGALSVALKKTPTATGDALDEDFGKVVSDCRRLGVRFVRIGMMPFDAMASKQACEAWGRECEEAARRLGAEGVTLCYHNHHVDLAQFDGERIFDIVRRVAPSLRFEVDLHWVQRGGMNPLDMLKEYAGMCKLIHVKDYRVVPLPPENMRLLEDGTPEARAEFMRRFALLPQFAEVGAGNMNWPELLPAALEAGAEHFFVEQDELYGRDPFDCLADSRAYLRSIGY
ncbi:MULTISPECIES: sugar phosphate isomerase/epimerase family protein [Micrococcales]|uniref:sugar phosphate isomerase/epimerase family protein n=1 Tax=Micrococcales TaxID=85006 RepID=UPI0004AA325E|nr:MULTISPECIES: sugar phosphate isomerase/epimerase [Micrococcales]